MLKKKIENFFLVSENKTTILKEILSGFITFIALIYIIPLVSSSLTITGMNENAVFVATALASGIACILVGLIIKKPLVQSVSLGMNTFFAYTICGELGYTWQEGLAIVFISAIIFLILTVTSVRKYIIEAIPKGIKLAISIGLGGFLFLSGLKNAGLIVGENFNISIGDLSLPIVWISLVGMIITIILMNLKTKLSSYAIAIGMVGVAAICFVLGKLGVNNMPTFFKSTVSFKSLKEIIFAFDFKVLLDFKAYIIIFVFTFMNIFDTSSSILSYEKELAIVDETGKFTKSNNVFLPDSIASVASTCIGGNTITTLAETKIMLTSGAKTGISSIVLGIMFIVSIFIYPLFTIFLGVDINGVAYNPITSIGVSAIGILLLSRLKEVDWKDWQTSVSTIVLLISMFITYSIPNGLGIGIITYVLLMILSKKFKELSKMIILISIIFIVYFVVIFTL